MQKKGIFFVFFLLVKSFLINFADETKIYSEMKKLTWILALLMISLTVGAKPTKTEPTKAQKRVAYTIKNLRLNAEQQKSLQPVLTAYLADLKAAKKTYEDMKKKYENDIDKGTLTDKVAEALLKAKFECEAKELEVKTTYRKKFAAIIPSRKVYICFSLINDKMSKVEGKKKSNDDDED